MSQVVIKTVAVPGTADYLDRRLPGWFAVLDRPDVEVGDRVAFVTADGTVRAQGKVTAVVTPGVLKPPGVAPEFKQWWKIVYRRA